MAVFLSPVGGVAAQFFTNTGAVLTGGKLYTYAAGTTTPAATYTSAAGATFNTNPIVLDAAGRVPGSGEIWLGEGVQYKFVLKDSNDVLIGTYDNVTGINSNFVNYNALEEIQVATAGQTVFNLTNSYQPGTNTLSVFVDGVNQYDGSSYSYTETSSTRVTFTQGLHVGALVKFTTAVTLSAGVVSSNLVTYLPAGTGAVATTVQAKLRQTVSVMDFGAVGDGVTNDWQACQEAIDYVQGNGGGTVLFPQGTYKIVNNTLVVWGSNVSLIGYGATIYKNDGSQSAGEYGDAIDVLGKRNGANYYSPQLGGSYTAKAPYTGTSAASTNINIEGFNVTFGTSTDTAINAYGFINCSNVTVKNCVSTGIPQTAFAVVSTANFNADHVLFENCISTNSGMQGFRFSSYNPNGGQIIAKCIDCLTTGTTYTVNNEPEQLGLPSSAFVRSSGNDVQFHVSFDNCEFDASAHLINGNRTTTFNNCRVAFVYALNGGANFQAQFNNTRIREFKTPSGVSTASQMYLDGRYAGAAEIVMDGCTFETPSSAQYSIQNYGFDFTCRNTTGGAITVYDTIYSSSYYNRVEFDTCVFQVPTSGLSTTLNSGYTTLRNCVINSPLLFSTSAKAITVDICTINVDSTFSTYCVAPVSTANASVAMTNNYINYTNTSYATVRATNIELAVLLNNTYLYNTYLSYDTIHGAAIPTTGYWQQGARVIRTTPSVGSPKAWVCTVAGAPGTWVSEGNL